VGVEGERKREREGGRERDERDRKWQNRKTRACK